MNKEVGAYEKERLKELSEKPNTTVLTADHEFKHDPWKASTLRPLLEGLATRVTTEFKESDSDFLVRKRCLEDPKVKDFQRQHPQLYWMLTDRKMVSDPRFKGALAGMLHVREKVDRGEVEEGQAADAMATTCVMSALGAGVTPS